MHRNNSANNKIKSKSKDQSKFSAGKSLPRNKTQKNLQLQNDHKIKIGIPISPTNKLKKITLNSCKSKDKPKFHISFQSNRVATTNSTSTLKSPKFKQKIVLPTTNLSKISEQKSIKQSKSQQYQYLEKKLRTLQQKLEKLKKKQGPGNHQKKKKSSKSKKSSSVQKKSFRQLERVQQQKSNDSDRNHQHELFSSIVTQVQQNKLKNCQSQPALHLLQNKNFVYYVSEVWQSVKEKIETSFTRHIIQSLNTIRYLQKNHKQHEKSKKKMPQKVKLPEVSPHKKTVIFDLDQTLIHCDQSTQQSYHTIVQIKLPNNQVIQAGVNIRPYAIQVLKRLSKKFQIIVFTASHSCYANVVIDYLDPKKQIFAGRFFRTNCLMTNDGMYIKDLTIFNRSLNNIVLVDNAAYSYFNQLDNGIPIIPYYNDDKDRQLLKLQKYLYTLLQVQDVRKVNHRSFRLRKYHQYDDPFVLVEELYSE